MNTQVISCSEIQLSPECVGLTNRMVGDPFSQSFQMEQVLTGWGQKEEMIKGRQKLGCNLIEAATLSIIHQINCSRVSRTSDITSVGEGLWQLSN